MNTQKIIKILLVLTLLFTAGCGKKYMVETTIYTDGSCLRTLIVTSDNSIEKDFFKYEYPIPVDSTWNLVIETDTNENGDTIFVHKASKLFENVNQLNQLYITDTSIYSCIERTVELKKKFRWFYTFLGYKETYPKLFDQPSLINYMDSVQYNYVMLSDEEQQKYLQENFDSLGADKFDDEVETRYFKWIERTILNACFDVVEISAKNVSNWPISDSEFNSKRDSLFTSMDKELILFEDEDIWDILNIIFGIDSVLLKELRHQSAFKEFEEKYLLFDDIFLEPTYINKVEMPGLIIETNSKMVSKNNEVEWQVGWDKYFTDDYEMFVQSRIVNKWAFIVSGIFILFLIIILILKKAHKNRNTKGN